MRHKPCSCFCEWLLYIQLYLYLHLLATLKVVDSVSVSEPCHLWQEKTKRLYKEVRQPPPVSLSDTDITGKMTIFFWLLTCRKSDVAALHPQQLTEHHALLKGQRCKKVCPDFHWNEGCVLNMFITSRYLVQAQVWLNKMLNSVYGFDHSLFFGVFSVWIVEPCARHCSVALDSRQMVQGSELQALGNPHKRDPH